MVDVENPDVGEAEPNECSRRMLTSLMGFAFFAFMFVFVHTAALLGESHPASTSAALIALSLLALFFGCWFGAIFVILVAEWHDGGVEGHARFADDLIQSDRFILPESIHQFLIRVDQHVDT